MSGAAGARRSTGADIADGNAPGLIAGALKGLIASALKGLCPRCGAPGMFAGVIRFADRCRKCGLDYGSFNVGDGPAALLTLVIGALIVIAAVTVELAFSPPFWVHAILWVPITAGAVVGSLRVAKAALLAAEYRNKAREGRLKE